MCVWGGHLVSPGRGECDEAGAVSVGKVTNCIQILLQEGAATAKVKRGD